MEDPKLHLIITRGGVNRRFARAEAGRAASRGGVPHSAASRGLPGASRVGDTVPVVPGASPECPRRPRSVPSALRAVFSEACNSLEALRKREK